MAANDEFPRGWHLTGGSGMAIPAVPKIVHILTDITASCRDTQNTGGFSNGTQLQINGNTFADFILEDWSPTPPANNWSAKDDFTWQGKMPFPINTAITITLTSGVSLAVITIQGYDI